MREKGAIARSCDDLKRLYEIARVRASRVRHASEEEEEEWKREKERSRSGGCSTLTKEDDNAEAWQNRNSLFVFGPRDCHYKELFKSNVKSIKSKHTEILY